MYHRTNLRSMPLLSTSSQTSLRSAPWLPTPTPSQRSLRSEPYLPTPRGRALSLGPSPDPKCSLNTADLECSLNTADPKCSMNTRPQEDWEKGFFGEGGVFSDLEVIREIPDDFERNGLLTLFRYLVPVVAIAFPVLVGWGLRHMPWHLWFTYHPILMSTAFPCMVLGRWVYVMGAKHSIEIDTVRIAHAVIMAIAACVMLGGYLCIFISHLEKGQFFGYNFSKHHWVGPMGLLHVYSGYAAIFLVIQQAVIGPIKLGGLQEGERKFRFHGGLGKLTVIMGNFTLITAVLFWKKWSELTKLAMLIAIMAMTIATIDSRPHVKNEELNQRMVNK